MFVMTQECVLESKSFLKITGSRYFSKRKNIYFIEDNSITGRGERLYIYEAQRIFLWPRTL